VRHASRMTEMRQPQKISKKRPLETHRRILKDNNEMHLNRNRT